MARDGKNARTSRAWHEVVPPLSPWMLSAISSMGFARMTPVQANCIPLFMGNKDVVVEAVTGGGKTLSYLIPVVERLLKRGERTEKRHVASIILCPTTELARQIFGVLQSLLAFHPASAFAARSVFDQEQSSPDREGEDAEGLSLDSPAVLPQLVVAGSLSPTQDLHWFLEHSPNVIIATPGRLLELLSSSHVQCSSSSFEVLVLDEADRLLDLGFKDELQNVIRRLPKQRRTGLFSATVSEALEDVIRVGLRNPVKVAVKVRSVDGTDDRVSPASLQICYSIQSPSFKIPYVQALLSTFEKTPPKTILYFSTCAAVEYFQHVLPEIFCTDRQPTVIVPLHGKQQQKVRVKNFERFANSVTSAILLTTDVAARGLDIPQVDLVVQIDPPNDPKTFLHRCGRAGRAGRKGLSIVFLQPGREEDYVRFLEVRKTPLSPYRLPEDVNLDEEKRLVTASIRKQVLKDRALHDKAQRAFVSWVRAYTKHEASSIFRIVDQDWQDLAEAWGLLKMPKMPELKHWCGDTSLDLEIDWETYGYREKAQESARQWKQLESREAEAANRKEKKRPWSGKTERHNDRLMQREKRQRKREHKRWESLNEEEKSKERELQEMIAKVRSEGLHTGSVADEFCGFD